MDTHYSYCAYYAARARRRAWLSAIANAAVLALATIIGWCWLAYALGGLR